MEPPPHITAFSTPTLTHSKSILPCGTAALTTSRRESLLRSVKPRGGRGGGGGGGGHAASAHAAALDRRLLLVRRLPQAAIHRGDQAQSQGVLRRLDLLHHVRVTRPLHVVVADCHQVVTLPHATDLRVAIFQGIAQRVFKQEGLEAFSVL